MLLTDGSLITVDDLLKKEGRIQTIAQATDIVLDHKLSDAVEAVQIEIQEKAQLASNLYWNPNRILGRYLYGDYTNTRLRNEMIVVTDPLRRWLALKCLELFFEDARARKVNDQTYERKFQLYRERALAASVALFSMGMGFVINPLPRPGALALSTPSGGSQGPRTYDVSITWVDANGNQSAPSVTQSQEIAVNSLLSVDISRLSPPAGTNVGQGNTPFTYGTAAGWNVWAAAAAGGTLLLQTATSISIATKTWTEPAGGLLIPQGGTAVGTGQTPDGFRNLSNVVMRG